MKCLSLGVAGAALLFLAFPAMGEESSTLESVLGAVVAVEADIPADARTAEALGTERAGYGVVIDADGLVVTIGYLILEAEAVTVTTIGKRRVPAQIVAYDHASGFGLLRAGEPLGVQPMALADSADLRPGDGVIVAGAGGRDYAMPARISSRRTFAGYWEYLLEDAIFTQPPYPVYGGAALIDLTGRLIGIGSLFVNDAAGPGLHSPGNMFVPIDLLKPLLTRLAETGRARGESLPWLGLYTSDTGQGVFVHRVAADGPAQTAGIVPGSLVVGVEGHPFASIEAFYRAIWALGPPGTTVHLTVIDPTGEPGEVAVVTADRYDWLKLGVRE